MWAYRDPENFPHRIWDAQFMLDYHAFSDDMDHTYIPLLAVHPENGGMGHGTSIVTHLVETAACYIDACSKIPNKISDFVFLDVYEESAGAIRTYQKCGFVFLGNCTYSDPINNKSFYVMAKRVPTSKSTPTL